MNWRKEHVNACMCRGLHTYLYEIAENYPFFLQTLRSWQFSQAFLIYNTATIHYSKKKIEKLNSLWCALNEFVHNYSSKDLTSSNPEVPADVGLSPEDQRTQD